MFQKNLKVTIHKNKFNNFNALLCCVVFIVGMQSSVFPEEPNEDFIAIGHLADITSWSTRRISKKIIPEDMLLITGDENGGIILWDLFSRKQLRDYRNILHDKLIVNNLTFSPDGKLFAYTLSEKHGHYYLRTHCIIICDTDSGNIVHSIRLVKDQETIPDDQEENLGWLSFETNDSEKDEDDGAEDDGANVIYLHFSKNGRYIRSVIEKDYEVKTKYYDITEKVPVVKATIGDSENHFASGMHGNSQDDIAPKLQEYIDMNTIHSIGYSPNINYTMEEMIHIFLEKRRITTNWVESTLSGASSSLSPDGKKVVTAYPDGTVSVWEVETGQTISEFKLEHGCYFGSLHDVEFADRWLVDRYHPDEIRSVLFLSNSNDIIVTSKIAVFVYNIQSRQITWKYEPPLQRSTLNMGTLFSDHIMEINTNNGKYLIVKTDKSWMGIEWYSESIEPSWVIRDEDDWEKSTYFQESNNTKLVSSENDMVAKLHSVCRVDVHNSSGNHVYTTYRFGSDDYITIQANGASKGSSKGLKRLTKTVRIPFGREY